MSKKDEIKFLDRAISKLDEIFSQGLPKPKKVSAYESFGMIRLPLGSRLTIYFKDEAMESNLTRAQAQKVLDKIFNIPGMNDENFSRYISVVARFPGGATMKL